MKKKIVINRILTGFLAVSLVLADPLSALAAAPDELISGEEISLDSDTGIYDTSDEELADGYIVTEDMDPDTEDTDSDQGTTDDDGLISDPVDDLIIDDLNETENDIISESSVPSDYISGTEDTDDWMTPEERELWEQIKSKPGYIHSDEVPETGDVEMGSRAVSHYESHAMGYSHTLGSPSDIYLRSSYTTPNLPSLRDQNPYGTCWAHGSMALAEISMIRQGYVNSSVNLSELQLAYYAYNRVVDPIGGTAGDIVIDNLPSSGLLDFGGRYDIAGNVLATWTGAVDEATVPYSWGSTVETKLKNKDEYAYSEDSAHLTDIYRVPIAGFDAKDETCIENQRAIKKLIVDYGAVGISFCASSSFYSSANNSFYCPDEYQSNHAVSIVGWDDDFSKAKFRTAAPGNGAWLVRNSWTTGNSKSFFGYFWMSYYDKSLDPEAVSFVFRPVDESFDNNYQYDGAVDWGYGCGYKKAANVFTAHAEEGGRGEVIKAVSFSTNDANVDYTVYVYTGLTNTSNPESGTKAATVSGSTLYPGTYMVELNKDVLVSPNERFSVVISMEKGSHSSQPSVAIEDEMYLGFPTGQVVHLRSSSKTGQSFTSNGSGWSGVGTRGNLRIKAFTDNFDPSTDVEPEYIYFSEAEVSLGAEEAVLKSPITIPEEAQYTKYTWTSSNPEVAVVSHHGLVTGVSAGFATITATAMNGVSASYTVRVNNYLRAIRFNDAQDDDWYGTYISVPLSDEPYRFDITTEPSDPDDIEDLRWSSDNPDVLTINSRTGIATLKSIGSCNVTAGLDDVSATVSVNVEIGVPDATAVNDGQNNIIISWPAVKGAEYYDLFRVVETYEIIGPYTYIYEDYEHIRGWEGGESFYSYTDTSHSSETKATSYRYIVYTYDYYDPVNQVLGNSKSTEITAYIGKAYNITYVLNGATNPETNPKRYIEGSTVSLDPPIPPSVGYLDAVWCSDSKLTKEKNQITSTDKGDKTFYARNNPIEYQIRYHYNDNAGKTELKGKYKYDQDVTLLKPTRSGFTFVGWNTETDYSGVTYTGGQIVRNLTAVNNDVIDLYAMWGYNITLNPGGGKCARSKIPVTMGASYGTATSLPDASEVTRTGYFFDGWYTEATGGSLVTDDTPVILGTTHTLYAHWTPITYNIVFDKNGFDPETGISDVSGSMEAMMGLSYGEGYDLSVNAFDRDKYGFKEWNTSADGSGTSFVNGATVSNLTDTDGATVTLYAQWVPAVYHVAFDANAADSHGTMSDINLTYGTASNLPANGYTRAGYSFAYWSETSEDTDGPEGHYDNRGEVLNLTSVDDATVTLYAHWEQLKVTKPYASLSSQGVEDGGKTIYDYGTRIYLTCDTAGADIKVSINGAAFSSYDDAIVLDNSTTESSGEYRRMTLAFEADKTGYRKSDPVTISLWIRDDSLDWGDLGKAENEQIKEDVADVDSVPSGIWIYGVTDKQYTGSAVTQPAMKIFYGRKMLNEGTDYTVKYASNTKAGTASVTVTGKGNYIGSVTKTYAIEPLRLDAEDDNHAALTGAPDISFNYNGKVQKGTTTVTYRMKNSDGTYKYVTLRSGTDFTYVYPHTNKKGDEEDVYDPTAFVGKKNKVDTTAGRGYEEYEVIIRGKGNYSGEAVFTERIYAVDDEIINVSKLKVSSIPAQTLEYGTYDAVSDTWTKDTASDTVMPCMPVPSSIKYAGVDLDSTDYSIRYMNNTFVGTATAVLTGKGRYTGSRILTFKINALQMSAVSVDGLQTLHYTGSEVSLPADDPATDEIDGYRLRYKVSRTAPEGLAILKEGRDYTVSYANNIKAGNATATFTGVGIYAGSLKKTFKISALSIAQTPGNAMYNTDAAGSISLRLGGSVVAQDMAEGSIALPYTKGGVKPVPELVFTNESGEDYRLAEGKDYTIKYSNNTAVNTYTGGEWSNKRIPAVLITYKGNFTGKQEVHFAITPSSLERVRITATDVKALTSAGCKTTVTLTDSNGSKLVSGTDYNKTFSYTYEYDTTVTHKLSRTITEHVEKPAGMNVDIKNDIIPAGTVIRVSVTGIKNYAGTDPENASTASTVFKIIGSVNDISKATVKIADQAYTGRPIEFLKKDLTVTLNKKPLELSDYRIVPGSFENNINKGTAKFIIEGMGEYGGRKTVTFKIVSRSSDFNITYDPNLAHMTGVFSDAGLTAPVITGTVKTGRVAEGKALARNSYKLNGFVFAGWNTEADGSGTLYASGGKYIPADEIMAAGYGTDVRVYAQWVPVNYKLTYVVNKGTNDDRNPVTFTILDTVNLYVPVRDGYDFGGWFYDSSCKSKSLDPGFATSTPTGTYIIPVGSTGNKTVYAKWTKLP